MDISVGQIVFWVMLAWVCVLLAIGDEPEWDGDVSEGARERSMKERRR